MREFVTAVTAVGLLLTAVSSVRALDLPLIGLASADSSSSIVGIPYCEGLGQPAETARQPFVQPGASSRRAGQSCAGFRFVQIEEMTNTMRAPRLLTDHKPVSDVDTDASTDEWIRMHYSIEYRSVPSSTLLCSRPSAGLAAFKYVDPHTPSAADLARYDANQESYGMPPSDSDPEPDGGAMLIACFLGMCAIVGRRVFSS